MANYINNDILCEAYSHLDIDIYHDPQKLTLLKTTLSTFFEERAKFLFGDEVKIEVDFEEGSLKTKLKVYGNAALILGAAISSYGAFRDSVHLLSEDAVSLAQSANLELIFRTRTAHCDRISIEKRKGIFGRVDELIREIDTIKLAIETSKLPSESGKLVEFNSTIDKFVKWNNKVGSLFEKLETDATEACIAAGLFEELQKFPDQAPWSHELTSNSFRVKLIQADPDKVGQIGASAKRYEEVTKSIKNNLKKILLEHATKKV